MRLSRPLRALAPLLSTTLALAQAHDAPSPVHPGARTVVCAGRRVPQLTDVTAKSGIHFSHVAAAEKKYIVESMSGGVLVIDFDRDGWPDLFFTNAPTVDMALKHEPAPSALFHNNHDGTFTDVTAHAGLSNPCFAMGGAVADYNNDGWPDLYLTCLGGNHLFRNNGDGTFTDTTTKAGVADGRWSTGAAFADYDGDGFVDLLVSNYVDFRLTDLPKFGSSPTCRFRGIDVQCGPRGLRGAGDSLFHNNGDGTFTDVSKAAGVADTPGYFGLGVIWSDFSNTGHPSLYIADDSTPNYLYSNPGHLPFTDISLESGTAVSGDGSEQGSMGVTVADYNHTDRFSIYITNFADEFNTLYRNDGPKDGTLQFTDVSYDAGVALASLPYVKWGTSFVDLDNDSWPDLFSVNGHVYPQVDTLSSGARYREPDNLFLNQRDGTFCDASAQAGDAPAIPHAGRGLAAVDLDNDGQIDLVVENIDGAPVLLHNAGIPGAHWLTLELAGTKSNRLAIGARLTLTAHGVTPGDSRPTVQTDEVRSGGSYLSQSDLRVHFGLGAATAVDALDIHWPSGATEHLTNLPVDRILSILEGKGVVDPAAIRPSAPATAAVAHR